MQKKQGFISSPTSKRKNSYHYNRQRWKWGRGLIQWTRSHFWKTRVCRKAAAWDAFKKQGGSWVFFLLFEGRIGGQDRGRRKRSCQMVGFGPVETTGFLILPWKKECELTWQKGQRDRSRWAVQHQETRFGSSSHTVFLGYLEISWPLIRGSWEAMANKYYFNGRYRVILCEVKRMTNRTNLVSGFHECKIGLNFHGRKMGMS